MLSGNTSTGELGSSVGKEAVCTTDGAAVLVEFDHEGYVVCHWPLLYGVFDADDVGVEFNVELPLVESVKVEIYEGSDEVELPLLEEVGSEYEVPLAEVLTEVFEYVIVEEVESVGTAEVAAVELSEVVKDDGGTALLEEACSADEVEELELDSVVTGSGTSIVTVGELTSMME